MEKLKEGFLFIALILVMMLSFLPAWLYRLYSGKWPSWYNLIHFQ